MLALVDHSFLTGWQGEIEARLASQIFDTARRDETSSIPLHATFSAGDIHSAPGIERSGFFVTTRERLDNLADDVVEHLHSRYHILIRHNPLPEAPMMWDTRLIDSLVGVSNSTFPAEGRSSVVLSFPR